MILYGESEKITPGFPIPVPRSNHHYVSLHSFLYAQTREWTGMYVHTHLSTHTG